MKIKKDMDELVYWTYLELLTKHILCDTLSSKCNRSVSGYIEHVRECVGPYYFNKKIADFLEKYEVKRF
jgi:hypothetical protein